MAAVSSGYGDDRARDDGAEEHLVTVRLLEFPLQVHARAAEHSADLRREFQLILEQVRDHPTDVPRRLVEVSTVLGQRYEGFTSEQEQLIEDGIEQGRTTLPELVFTLPAHAGEAAAQLGGILDEADAFCRSGQLLTLATPDDLVTYRRWYLASFIDQCAGAAPVAWSGPLA